MSCVNIVDPETSIFFVLCSQAKKLNGKLFLLTRTLTILPGLLTYHCFVNLQN